jgi:hypothetical protein
MGLTCGSAAGVRHQVERPRPGWGEELLDERVQVVVLELESVGCEFENVLRFVDKLFPRLLDLDFRSPSLGVIGHAITQCPHFLLVLRHLGHHRWIRVTQKALTDESFFQRKMHAQLARERGQIQPGSRTIASESSVIEQGRNVLPEPT